MNIVLFESVDSDNFYPLSLNRPIFLLRLGISTLLCKMQSYFPQSSSWSYIIRDYLKSSYKDFVPFDFSHGENIKSKEDYLFIRANVLLEERPQIVCNEAVLVNNEVICFRIKGSLARKLEKDLFFKEEALLKDFLERESLSFVSKIKAKKVDYLFDLVSLNKKEIIGDIARIDKLAGYSHKGGEDLISCDNKLFISSSSKVHKEGVSFILDNGPIFIDDDVSIKPFSVIEGPCYIGKHSVIDGATVRGGSSIGSYCKIGGEVSNSIIMDYTNKAHAGFLGNSYIGAFVNFGALSTTSDLKNNYSCVTIFLKNKYINTNSIKIGSFIGDHSKLGIGSLLNSGTVIGFGCNLYFEGIMYPKYLPSFLWGGKYPFSEYIFSNFVKTARNVLKRRGQVLTEDDISLYDRIFFGEEKIRFSFFK